MQTPPDTRRPSTYLYIPAHLSSQPIPPEGHAALACRHWPEGELYEPRYRCEAQIERHFSRVKAREFLMVATRFGGGGGKPLQALRFAGWHEGTATPGARDPGHDPSSLKASSPKDQAPRWSGNAGID